MATEYKLAIGTSDQRHGTGARVGNASRRPRLCLAFTIVLSRARSVELQKANLEGGASGAGGSSSSPLASAIPLAQLLSKSGALGALNSLSALGGLTDLLAGAASPPVQTTGVHRAHKSFGARRGDDDPPAKSKERNKYNPY